MKDRFPACARGENLFNYRPMVYFAIGLCCGIFLGRQFLGGWGYAAGIIAFISFFFLKRAGFLRSALCILALGLGLIRIQFACPSFSIPKDPVILSGTIATTPEETHSGYTVILKNAKMDGNALPGKVLLNITDQEHQLPLAYSQKLQAQARLFASSQPRNEGGFDQETYDLQRGICCRAACNSELYLYEGRPGFEGVLIACRQWIRNALYDLYGAKNGALAAGFLLGETENIVSDTMQQFRDAGITHLLAVSGLHVSILTGVLIWLLKGLKNKTRLYIVSIFLFLYAALCGFSASILRAGIMAFIFLLCQTKALRYDPPSALALSAILLLFIHPFFLFSAGFLLSYSAVLGIFLLYPILLDGLYPIPKRLAQGISVSCSAQFGTLTASAGLFHQIPLMGVFTNIIAVPLTSLVLLPACVSLVVYPISPVLAKCVGIISDGTLTLLTALAEFAADFPILTLPTPPLFAAIMLWAGLIFLSRFCLAGSKLRTALFGLCLTISLISWSLPSILQPASHITVLDVPYGYAAHIHSPTGDTLIGTKQGLDHTNVRGYCSANNIQTSAIQVYDSKQLTIEFNDTLIVLSSGNVRLGNEIHYLSDTGQLRIWTQDNSIRMKSYINDP